MVLTLDWIAEVTGTRVERKERIQSLWSGYGELFRVTLDGQPAVVKDVRPPTAASHPRGWNTDRGHERKLASYAVERTFYERYATRCRAPCRVPKCLATRADDNGWTFVFEDLDAAGFPGRRGTLDADELERCVDWLACFHATFLGETPEGLWPCGTYWHLETRPDELEAMTEPRLRDAAVAIDAKLESASHRTLVHGDAKFANFCFGDRGVAAVDFQYVGGGCGMKDIAYFFSCLSSETCDRVADDLLERYFASLRRFAPHVDHAALEAEWRALYPYAWADFERFLDGWAPGHWKRTSYADRQTSLALSRLNVS